jgi:peptide/nickel transport system permease protein
MLKYAFQRLLVAIMVALTVSIVSFGLIHYSGDVAVAMAGEGATSSDIEAVRHEYGLDKPVPVQYFQWLGGVLTGDLGMSYYWNKPVTTLLAQRLPVTLTLGVCALCFALILALPLGILAALWPNSWVDRFALGVSVFGQAIPTFWFGLLMMLLFAVILGWLPVSGSESWKSFIMPSIALGYYATPAFMRLTRSGMIDVLNSDYIRTARAKGLSQASIILKHALRNAVAPVVSLASVQLGFMLGGSVVIETVFALNGVGFLAWQSISRADFPVVQSIVLILALFFVVLTFVADLLNAFLDPRMRVA